MELLARLGQISSNRDDKLDPVALQDHARVLGDADIDIVGREAEASHRRMGGEDQPVLKFTPKEFVRVHRSS